MLILQTAAILAFVHDEVLPNHVPKDCKCASWDSNSSSKGLWANQSLFNEASTSCAMPANALTPDLALPEYSPSDGWCICENTDSNASSNWYTWCAPPPDHPSQLNLLVVNASSIAVNFVTADMGARSGCVVEAELADPEKNVLATLEGDSSEYRDSTAGRVLSYHHVTLSPLQERTPYLYRVRVSDRSSSKGPHEVTWKETTGVKWCSGGNYALGYDPFGAGLDGDHCALLPAGVVHDVAVAMCEEVCAAPNASVCMGFTLYPHHECCFRTNTASMPADPTSSAECYEKRGAPVSLPCTSDASQWSDWRGFRSLYSAGVTRVALYADMGVFVAEGALTPAVTRLPAPAQHNVGNVLDDWRAGRIDFVMHSGDLAYEFEVNGGGRGDGFMDSYSQLLSHAPWAPGWGNHEYLEEDRGNRLAAITRGMVRELGRQAQNREDVNAGTNRMAYSVNVGLLHVLHLDLSPYWCRFEGCIGVDTCGVPDEWVMDASSSDPETRYNFSGYRNAQMEFARADLASVNRSRTPWVIVTAHYPMYDTIAAASAKAKQARGSAGLGLGTDASPAVASRDQAVADFEPLLAEHAVDMYFAGHNHNYETSWPLYKNKVTQKNFIDAEAPVHVLSGSAGPPEWDAFQHRSDVPEWSREPRIIANTYSRLTLWNATTATFEQVANDNGSVLDQWTIVQRRRNRSAPFKCMRAHPNS